MRIALAQIAPPLGDPAGSLRLHLQTARRAVKAGADLVVFPELSLTGYRLQDLVPEVAMPIDPGGPLRPLYALSRRISIAFGMVEESEGHRYYNSAVFLEGGKVRHVHRKVYLPTYGMFEEGRYFAAGDAFTAFRSRLGRIGMLVCEDLWHPASALLLAQDGADYLLVLANSPVQAGQGAGGQRNHETWRDLIRVTAQLQTVYVLLTNRAGCEDGISFSGASAAVDPLGEVLAEGRMLGEDLVVCDLDRRALRRARTFYPLLRDERLPVLQREIGRLLAASEAARGPGGS
jgi:predicted amidohydrolase